MSGQAYKVTAFYDTKQGAEAGADMLKREGIAASNIDVIHGEAGTEHETGFMDKLSNLFLPEEDRHAYAEGVGRGGYVLSVDVTDADHHRVVELLDTEQSVDLDERSGSWRQEGWSGRNERLDTAAPAAGATAGAAGDEQIQVAEEQLKVGKRDVSHGRVRVRSYTVEEDVSADVTLESRHADVERHATDRVVTGAEADRVFQDKEVVVEESAEEAVVQKETHVVEEIDVHEDVERRTETVTDTVRRTEVDVDRDADVAAGTNPR